MSAEARARCEGNRAGCVLSKTRRAYELKIIEFKGWLDASYPELNDEYGEVCLIVRSLGPVQSHILDDGGGDHLAGERRRASPSWS